MPVVGPALTINSEDFWQLIAFPQVQRVFCIVRGCPVIFEAKGNRSTACVNRQKLDLLFCPGQGIDIFLFSGIETGALPQSFKKGFFEFI